MGQPRSTGKTSKKKKISYTKPTIRKNLKARKKKTTTVRISVTKESSALGWTKMPVKPQRDWFRRLPSLRSRSCRSQPTSRILKPVSLEQSATPHITSPTPWTLSWRTPSPPPRNNTPQPKSQIQDQHHPNLQQGRVEARSPSCRVHPQEQKSCPKHPERAKQLHPQLMSLRELQPGSALAKLPVPMRQ